MRLKFWEQQKKDQIASVISVYETNARLKSENKQELHMWLACGAAATKLIQDFQKLPAFEVADTLNKARLCLELGLQPMLTVWHFERAPEETEDTMRSCYTKVQDFIDELRWTLKENTVDLYTNFDSELRIYLSSLARAKETYAGMFHLRYRECVSTDQIINLQNLGAPVETWNMFLDDCKGYASMMLEQEDIDTFFQIFNNATAHLLKQFDYLEQSDCI